MNKLRTRFGLALCLVLLVATLLPILAVYLLGSSGLLEVTYVTAAQLTGQADSTSETPEATDRLSLAQMIEALREDGSLPSRRDELLNGTRIPILAFDQESGRWIVEIPSDLQRVVVSSPVTKFRLDVPAWFVLGSLPLVSLLIGIVLSIWMSRSVTRPVSQLAEAVHAVGRRELGYRVAKQGSQELQELAQSFNRMADDLESAERNRRNLMADVAHELRTPLSVLEGNLRALLDGVHEQNEEEIALLYEQTHHLKRLVDDLRELSLAESDQLSLNRQEVNLAQLVKDTLVHFDFIAQERGIHLSADIEEPLLHPALDDQRMRQILHNLLSNAIRFTPQGGSVSVTMRSLPENKAVEISVADTGAGILPEELPQIFDRFNRTRRSPDGNGTGLGLAIVKAIVEALGGSVDAQSAGKDQGSTFRILLPMQKTIPGRLA